VTRSPLSVVLFVFSTGLVLACGGSDSTASREPSAAGQPAASPGAPPPAVVAADAATNLDTTPLSAADYALYANIMGGASALLGTMTVSDREALELLKNVDAGKAKPTPSNDKLLAQARALKHKDEELADLQGVGERYRKVKQKVEAVIGPDARPPAADDIVARENLRFLEAHRATIERLQRILRDPLSKPAPEQGAGEPIR
jgi:hypothetical protein